jgi:hypothetical protein
MLKRRDASPTPPQDFTAVVPALHCASLPITERHQQNQGHEQEAEVCHTQCIPARSTPSRSGDSINGTRAVLGCRSCLGNERTRNRSRIDKDRIIKP